MKKRILGFGILVGLSAIILAIVCFCQSTGHTVSSKTYGGDAYTGIQNASSQAANNTYHLACITKLAGGSILLVSGLFAITFFGLKLLDEKNNNESTTDLSDLIQSLNNNLQQAVNKNKTNDSTDSQPNQDDTKGSGETNITVLSDSSNQSTFE